MIVSNGKKKRKKVGIEDELNSEKCRDEVEKRSAFLSLSLSFRIKYNKFHYKENKNC